MHGLEIATQISTGVQIAKEKMALLSCNVDVLYVCHQILISCEAKK